LINNIITYNKLSKKSIREKFLQVFVSCFLVFLSKMYLTKTFGIVKLRLTLVTYLLNFLA